MIIDCGPPQMVKQPWLERRGRGEEQGERRMAEGRYNEISNNENRGTAGSCVGGICLIVKHVKIGRGMCMR